MAMNLVQAGSAGGVGLISGVLESQPAINLGGQSVAASMLAEIAAVAGGTVLQFVSPYTMPSVVDGLVDGGIALLARRIVGMVQHPAAAAGMRQWAGSPAATRVGAFANGRGMNASGVDSNKYQFV